MGPPATLGRLVSAVLTPLLLVACSSASAGADPSALPAPEPTMAAPGPGAAAGMGAPADTAAPVDTVLAADTVRAILRGVDMDTVRAGRFDQGKMWTFEFPPVRYFEEAYGLALDSAWFRSARLSALRIPGCSASFVSPNGLVMTNHHCAREFVTQVSGEGENLLDEGFYAADLAEERVVEDFEADQLVEIVDITTEVRQRTRGLTGTNLTEATETATTEIAERMQEERGGEEDGWIVEPISLYNGARFSAYVFRRYTNARLVMAPELQTGFFGGDPDNFTYPRYNLDVAFFRLYGDDGDPLETEHYFEWSPEGVRAGDPIFIVGNPGSTSRLQTVAELEFRRDVSDRALLEFIQTRAAILEDFIGVSPEEAERYDLRNELFGLENQEKAMLGQLAGLNDPAIIARRLASERELQDSILADSARAEQYGDLVTRLAALQEEKRENAAGYGAFLGLTAPGLASPTLHRGLLAFQVLSAQQSGQRAVLDELMDEVRAVPGRPAALDQELIAARIEAFVEHLGADHPTVESILQGRTPAGAAAVIHDGSALSDSAAAVQALERGDVQRSDPAIAFVGAYLNPFIEFQGTLGGTTEREEQLHRDIGQVRFDIYGTTQPPDATFSLRIADGAVRGYEYNGTVAPPYTTLYGLFDRYHSFRDAAPDPEGSPWGLTPRWLEARPSLDLSTPINFVSTADIISGNSGSPVVDSFLRVVGVVFDGNIESLPGEYIYLPEINRAVAVDTRGILEALEEVYGMDRIVAELTTGQLAAPASGVDSSR